MTVSFAARIGMASWVSLCRASRQLGPDRCPTSYRFYARRGTRTPNAIKTTAFEAAAFANFAMRAIKAPLFGHRWEACGESARLIRKARGFVNQ